MKQPIIYEMELHEVIHIDDNSIRVQRVPGGWLYGYFGSGPFVFVPFDDEFMIVQL